MPSGKNKVMFGVPSLISSQSQQLGQNLNLGQEYTPETAAKMQALERRQQLANILLQQGMQPKEARQAGRFVVAPSLWEQAAGPLTTAMGALSSLYLDDQRSAVASDEAKRVAAAYQAYNEGTSDVPEFKGRTVPGTERPAVPEQPAVDMQLSNLNEIIGDENTQRYISTSAPNIRERVVDALANRDLKLKDPRAVPPVTPQPLAYTPPVEGQLYQPGLAAVPARRMSALELVAEQSPELAAKIGRGQLPSLGADERAIWDKAHAESLRPASPSRPRTPSELMAADTALLASGAPGAWPLIQLTKQQREMDLARKETLEERADARIAAHNDRMDRLRQEKQLAQEKLAMEERWHQDTTETKRLLAELKGASDDETARHNRAMEKMPRPVIPVTVQDPNDKSGAGTIVIDAATGKAIGKGPKLTERGKLDEKAARATEGIDGALNAAEDILMGITRSSTGEPISGRPLPTGSTIGSLADTAAGWLGASSSGADLASSLETLGATITSKQPRFEGPQSDADVKFYKEMAGKIGDRTVPISQRLEAIKTIRNLRVKYGSGISSGKTPEEAARLNAATEKYK